MVVQVNIEKRILYGSAGVLYGGVLIIFGLWAIGAGHGVYMPLYIGLSPFFAGPIVWGFIGALLPSLFSSSSRKLMISLILVQWLGIICGLFFCG